MKDTNNLATFTVHMLMYTCTLVDIPTHLQILHVNLFLSHKKQADVVNL